MSLQDSNWTWPMVGVAAGLFYVIASTISGRKRAFELLDGWARDHRFVLLSARRRSFVPFWRWGGSTSGYQFFRVTIRNGSGLVCRSWIRCSDFAHGNPQSFEVIWDDEPRKNSA
jgi:hypothetical protein